MLEFGVDKLGNFFFANQKDSYGKFIFYRGNIIGYNPIGISMRGADLKFRGDLIITIEKEQYENSQIQNAYIRK